MSGRSVNLTTLFLGRLRPPKRFINTSCTYFLTTALLESAEGETWPDRVSNPGSLTFESDALPTALHGPSQLVLRNLDQFLR